jgi:asparagine synthetase B (glutamine-hydrolysing)
MSDFIVSLDKRYRGEDLLNLIKRPYGKRAPGGRCFDFGWGSMAVLEERLAVNKNIITMDTATFAWVGDLVVDFSNGFVGPFVNRLRCLQELADDRGVCLKTDALFQKLNGTFAIVFADATGFSIVTDPMSFIPVYMGKNKRANIISFGTHLDLVSAISGGAMSFDVVSAAEFLNTGRPTFPNTMYIDAKQLNPGSVYCVRFEKNRNMQVQDLRYWLPPQEICEGFDVREAADELVFSFLTAVRERCGGGKVAVALSGGLDSRLVIAAVPKDIECVAFTFGETMNRELKTAQKAAKTYNRPWFPLLRDKEFLERSLIKAVSLAGCENDWVHAHGIGFVENIEEFGIAALIGGNGMDSFLRGYDAKDMVPVKRLGGILPTSYVKVGFRYENIVTFFWGANLEENVLEQMHVRRRAFHDNNLDPNRVSMAELLLNYPHSQNDCASSITVDRRLLPVRTCAADRRILDFGFKCPIELKLGSKIFFMAARRIYGNGLHIPSANDGVRPCSGHWWRLAQRAGRKLHNRTSNILEKFGKEKKIQHSWHDYQKYWQESKALKELIEEYGANLDRLGGILFRDHGQDLLRCRDLHWRDGFRLLQLAVWLGIKGNYTLTL